MVEEKREGEEMRVIEPEHDVGLCDECYYLSCPDRGEVKPTIGFACDNLTLCIEHLEQLIKEIQAMIAEHKK